MNLNHASNSAIWEAMFFTPFIWTVLIVIGVFLFGLTQPMISHSALFSNIISLGLVLAIFNFLVMHSLGLPMVFLLKKVKGLNTCSIVLSAALAVMLCYLGFMYLLRNYPDSISHSTLTDIIVIGVLISLTLGAVLSVIFIGLLRYFVNKETHASTLKQRIEKP